MKSFKELYDEEVMSTSSGVSGIGPGEIADFKHKKKRKKKVLTRNYIEVAGKRKKLVK
tara:strand:+ start:2860 stop:3033 length:174 start_codon:yes stop_codon:yes gene_type:complete